MPDPINDIISWFDDSLKWWGSGVGQVFGFFGNNWVFILIIIVIVIALIL